MKHCYLCKNYGQLINQGYWWCELQHEDMNPDTCKDYDELKYKMSTYNSNTYYSKE